MGNVIPTAIRRLYQSADKRKRGGGNPLLAMNVNPLCGSSLQAIISMAQATCLRECDFVIGAGTESTSNAPHMTSAARFAQSHWRYLADR